MKRKMKIPWRRVIPYLRDLFEQKWSKEDAIEHVSELLDTLLVMPALVPGPAGVALEAVDGPVIRAGLEMAWEIWEKRA